jgi:hypothetical protein
MEIGRVGVAEAEHSTEVRWSGNRTAHAVTQLLRGEGLDELSRESRVEAHRLAAWRDELLADGIEGLTAQLSAPRVSWRLWVTTQGARRAAADTAMHLNRILNRRYPYGNAQVFPPVDTPGDPIAELAARRDHSPEDLHGRFRTSPAWEWPTGPQHGYDRWLIAQRGHEGRVR